MTFLLGLLPIHQMLIKEAVDHDDVSSEESQYFCSHHYAEDQLYAPDSDEGIFNNNTFSYYYHVEAKGEATDDECSKTAEFGTDADSAMFDGESIDRQMVDVAIQLDEEELKLITQEAICKDVDPEESANSKDGTDVQDENFTTIDDSGSCDEQLAFSCQGQDDDAGGHSSLDLEQTTEGQPDITENYQKPESGLDILDQGGISDPCDTDGMNDDALDLRGLQQVEIENEKEPLNILPQTLLESDTLVSLELLLSVWILW